MDLKCVPIVLVPERNTLCRGLCPHSDHSRGTPDAALRVTQNGKQSRTRGEPYSFNEELWGLNLGPFVPLFENVCHWKF